MDEVGKEAIAGHTCYVFLLHQRDLPPVIESEADKLRPQNYMPFDRSGNLRVKTSEQDRSLRMGVKLFHGIR